MQTQQQLNKSESLDDGKMQTGFKFKQIWMMQNQNQKQVSNNKVNEKCIILVGSSNVGKTSLLYYLSGLKLILKQNTSKKTFQMQAEHIYQKAVISNTLSTTDIPNIFSCNDSQQETFSLIDMPAMNDTRPLNFISNIFIFSHIFEEIIKEVHIVFVITQGMLDAQQIVSNLRQIVLHFNVDSFKQLPYFSLVFTKTGEDQEDIKDTFYQILDELQEELDEDDQEVKDILTLINILQQLKEQVDLIYTFPKQQPTQQKGLEITRSILKRDQFYSRNSQLSILHKNFTENIVQNTTIKINTFQSTVNELTQESCALIQKAVEFAIYLGRIVHTNLAMQLFASQDDFKTKLKAFCQSYHPFFFQFNQDKNHPAHDLNNPIELLQQSIQTMISNLQGQSQISSIYKKLKTILSTFEQQGKSQLQGGAISNSLILVITTLSQLFQEFAMIFKTSQQNYVISESLSNISKVVLWIQNVWFGSQGLIPRVDILSRRKDMMKQTQCLFRDFINKKYIEIREDVAFFNVIVEFSEKTQKEDQEWSQQQKSQVAVGFTLSELKGQLLKIKDLESIQQIVQQRIDQNVINQQLFDKAKGVVMQLQKQVFESVKKFEQPELNYEISSQKLRFLEFQFNFFAHKQMLQSSMRNFCTYLRFIIHANQDNQDKTNVVMNKFIENLCRVLKQYSLFEEQILLYLFVNNLKQMEKVLSEGFTYHKISQDFIKNQLLIKITGLSESVQSHQQMYTLEQIYVKCYNYLISDLSVTREQQNYYENQFQKQLNLLEDKFKIMNSKKINSNQQQTGKKLKLNYSILDAPTFSARIICQKVNLIDQRNKKSKIRQIYKHYTKKRKDNFSSSQKQTPNHQN